MGAALKHVPYKYDLSDTQFDSVRRADDFSHVKLLKHKKKGAPKMLLVLDWVPAEDLGSSRLLSGATGDLLTNILQVSRKMYGANSKLNDYDWLAVPYSVLRTVGKTKNEQDAAYALFDKRLNHIICEYKPDIVVTFGPKPYSALNKEKIRYANNNYQNWYGVPIKTKVKAGKSKHKFLHVPTLSLNTLINSDGSGTEMYLAGYLARNLVNALEGKLRYAIPKKPEFKTVYVDTMDKFKSMMRKLKDKPYVAVDTETENLNRRKNKIQTIQFAYDTNKAYVVPIYHKDTPFAPKELKRIIRKVREYFETAEKTTHVYANAVFDLNVIRNSFGVRFFPSDVWDLFAGEFVLDENLKVLSGVTGAYYYSLGNLTMQYGSTVYYDIEFGKEMRKTIVNADMNKALVEYCALDVIVPLYIMEQQKRRGKDIGHAKYENMVQNQISDMVNSFSTWEHTGVKTDIQYLFYLKSKQSPIRQIIGKIEDDINNSKAVAKCNKRLMKQSGTPSKGLFGVTTTSAFDLSKKAHLSMLMFDVLKLKPLGFGKEKKDGTKGDGKIDKKFQKEYADVPEVALYSELQGAKKLYNAYVKAFIKQWGRDVDMRSDSRIRPHFKFLDVVTGRTSASDPSLHQIPSRSELGKNIKRLFVTDEGRIVIKVDYSAHEVRCWSLITGDKEIADVFDVGRVLREKFKLAPSAKLAEAIDQKGDVHKINASYFFGVPIDKVDKPTRNSVKGVIFGLIYQQGIKGLAVNTGQTEAAITELVAKFLKRFPIGVGWFDEIKAFGRKNLFVESPLGRRRYLWGFLTPKGAKNYDSIIASMERRSVNSPVQGMGSDFLIIGTREIERLKYEHYKKTGHYPDFQMCNSVHDSIEIECAYEDFWLAIKIIEEGLTSAVAERVKQRYGMEFTVPLEIDFEVGPTGKHVQEWNYDYDTMAEIIRASLKFQKKYLGHKINVDKVFRTIMEEQYETMPDWMKKQLWNKKIKVPGMSVDPRSKDERAKAKRTKVEKIVLKDEATIGGARAGTGMNTRME